MSDSDSVFVKKMLADLQEIPQENNLQI